MGNGSDPSDGTGQEESDNAFAPDTVDRFLRKWFDQDLTARILVTRDLAIVKANDAARKLIARHPTLAVQRGRFDASDEKQSEQIAQIVRDDGKAPRSLVMETDDGPGLLVRPQRIDVAGQVTFGLTLRTLNTGDDEGISDLADHFALTPTEDRILHALAAGRTARQIAEEANCSRETIRSHIRNIYRKVGVNSRIDLLRHLTKYKL